MVRRVNGNLNTCVNGCVSCVCVCVSSEKFLITTRCPTIAAAVISWLRNDQELKKATRFFPRQHAYNLIIWRAGFLGRVYQLNEMNRQLFYTNLFPHFLFFHYRSFNLILRTISRVSLMTKMRLTFGSELGRRNKWIDRLQPVHHTLLYLISHTRIYVW